MRSCSNVTVGHYQATKVRATSNLGCKAARSDLSLWLKQPTVLPHNAKSWHAKLVKGTWQMAYGKYPTSLHHSHDRIHALAGSDRDCASATFRIRGLGGLSVASSRGEQPRGRQAIAWLRLSDTDNERAGGTTAALLLAGFGCPAIAGWWRSRRDRLVFSTASVALRVDDLGGCGERVDVCCVRDAGAVLVGVGEWWGQVPLVADSLGGDDPEADVVLESFGESP